MARERLTVTWRIVEATVTGPNHRRAQLPNQDSSGVRALGPDGWVLAVADGAGSAARSDEGSALAVRVALDQAAQMMAQGLPESPAQWQAFASHYGRTCLQAFDAALRTVADSPIDGGSERGDFATTLLAVVARPPWFVLFSVGDGFLLAERDPGGVHLVVPPPLDREHLGETTFLTSADRIAEQRLEIMHDPGVRGLALCTDGLIEGLLGFARGSGGSPVPVAPENLIAYFDFVRDETNSRESLQETLGSAQFAATSGDDKTIVLAARR